MGAASRYDNGVDGICGSLDGVGEGHVCRREDLRGSEVGRGWVPGYLKRYEWNRAGRRFRGDTDRRVKYPPGNIRRRRVGVNDDSGGTVLLGDVGFKRRGNFCHSGTMTILPFTRCAWRRVHAKSLGVP